MRIPRTARWLMLALIVCCIPASSWAGVFISVNFGPPVLPVYVQPPCPAADLIWTPGYWAYGDMGYYWVPGAWVPAPFVGGLWTPGYWGWGSGLYMFHPGYWGYHVGYYGGVNYGGGYLGIGFAGGEWRGGHMAYNTAVINVNTTVVHTTFVDRTIIETHTVNNPGHVAFAGGPGGVQHTATSEEQVAARETHTPPTTFQAQHETTAQQDRTSWARTNGGHPRTLAAARPLAIESKPAPSRPAMARPAAGGGARSFNNAARPAAPASQGAIRPASPNTPPARTNSTPRMNPAPRENAAPRANPPAPRENAAPRENTRPAPKPKPEGHDR